MTLERRLGEALDRTEEYILARDYRGYDPYDGLMSPMWSWPGLRSWHQLRWAWQQLVKRMPVAARPVLGIKPGRNPVTLALCLQAFGHRDVASRSQGRRERQQALVHELQSLVSPGWSGPCWGYDFNWEGRFTTTPKGFPTVVATGFVTNACWETQQRRELSGSADLVRESAQFVVNDLKRTVTEQGACWSYSPQDTQAVVNASLKGARICAQAVSLGAPAGLLDEARPAVTHALAHQLPSGAWPYSVSDDRSWADHFHTCYVLDCLDAWVKLTGDEDARQAIDCGWRYYRDHFFTSDGAPRYFDQKTWPVDATACGQALLTLIRFGDLEQARKVATWCLDHLAHSDGTFAYQIGPLGPRRSVYMRWSVAWMFLGLSCLEEALAS